MSELSTRANAGAEAGAAQNDVDALRNSLSSASRVSSVTSASTDVAGMSR